MGRRHAPARRRSTPTALAAAAMLLLMGALAALMSSGTNIFGKHSDWTASLAAVTNSSAAAASGLLDGSSLLRSTVANLGAAVATGSITAEGAGLQQSTSNSGGSDSNIQQSPDRMVIVAHLTEDLSWLPMHLGDTPTAVYQFVPNLEQHRQHCPQGAEVDRPHECPRFAAGHVGREASAYLQFIHDHYDSLPATMLFLHGHEKGWHRSSAVRLVRKLKWGALPFANIRHWGFTDWECQHEAQQRGERPCSALGYCLTPADPKAANDPLLNEPDAVRFYAVGASQMLAQHWDALFKEELGDLPAMIAEPACCAEFMVTRERVRQRPLSFYKNALDVLHAAKDADSFALAVSFEAVWHMILGEPPIVHAVSKCDAFECSEEERSDTRLKAPPVPQPYMLHHRWAAQQQQAAAASHAMTIPEQQSSAAAHVAAATSTTADAAADSVPVASRPADADQLTAAAMEAMADTAQGNAGAAHPEHAAVQQKAEAEPGGVQQVAAAGAAGSQQAGSEGHTEAQQSHTAEATNAPNAAATESAEVQQQEAAAVIAGGQNAGDALGTQPDQIATAADGQQAAATEGQDAAEGQQPLEMTDLLVGQADSSSGAGVGLQTDAFPADGQASVGSGADVSEQQGAQRASADDEAREQPASTNDGAAVAATLQQAMVSTGQTVDRELADEEDAGATAESTVAD